MRLQFGTWAGLVLGSAIACTPPAVLAAGHTVKPGDSIQAAIDAAAPGDVIKVEPGDYTEAAASDTAAIRVTKSIKLIAKSKLPTVKVRIIPSTPPVAGQNNGILVEPANPTDPDVNGVMIKGFTVEGFPNNGIWLRHVQNYKLMGNESINNLENGIFPTLSANGLVKKNLSYGSQDSALWIEASENVRALGNELHGSPTGLEITVSKNIDVKKNDIHDNTVGVGLYHPNAASQPPLGGDGFWTLSKNHIHNNNAPNTAPAGTMSAALPSGAGVLVLGVDHITVEKNLVENNDFLGIGVLDWCLAVGLSGASSFDCTSDPPIVESAPDNDEVKKNDFTSNGSMPPAGFEPFASDMLFIPGMGQNDCFNDNTATITFPTTGIPTCK